MSACTCGCGQETPPGGLYSSFGGSSQWLASPGGYLRDKGPLVLLRWDLLLVVLGVLVPHFLTGIPGNLGTFLGGGMGAVVIGGPIRAILANHYRVEPPGRRKER